MVLHFQNGEILKGSSYDFFPDKRWFLFKDGNTEKLVTVEVEALKGIFFVRAFTGDPGYRERLVSKGGIGKRVLVLFKDGEVLVGYTLAVSPERIGFYLFIPDPGSNNEKVFVIKSATEKVILK